MANNKTIKALEKVIADQKEELEEAYDRIDALEDQVAQAEDENQDLTRQLHRDLSVARMLADITELKKQNKKLEERAEKAESKALELESKLGGSEKPPAKEDEEMKEGEAPAEEELAKGVDRMELDR